MKNLSPLLLMAAAVIGVAACDPSQPTEPATVHEYSALTGRGVPGGKKCDTVVFSPDSYTLDVGNTVQVVPSVQNKKGNEIPGESVTWSIQPPSVAVVSSTGLVTGVGSGFASLFAYCAADPTAFGYAVIKVN